MRKRIVLVLMIFAVMSSLMTAMSALAAGPPPLPHAFWGGLTINGKPAAVGTVVKATGTGVVDAPGNPLTTTVKGKYGGGGAFDQKLVVQGDLQEGAVLSFTVNGAPADQTAVWYTGGLTQLDLTVTTTSGPPSSVNVGLIAGIGAGVLVIIGAGVLMVRRMTKR